MRPLHRFACWLPALPSRSRRRSRRRKAFSRQSESAEVLETRTLLTLAPAQPVIETPGHDPDRLAWSDGQTASSWELWVNNLTTGENAVIYARDLSQPEFDFEDDMPDGRYRAWVRGSNVHGRGVWSRPVEFSLGNTTPADAPRILGPQTTPLSDTIRFSWTEVAHAETYELWVNDVSGGRSRVIHVRDLTSNSFTPEEGLSVGRYRMWVRASNGAGSGPWSSPHTFHVTSVQPRPDRPVLLTPEPGDSSIHWQPDDAADRYEIWINNLTTDESRVVHERNITGTRFDLPEDLDAGRYRIWLRAFNEAGNSLWSRPVELTRSNFDPPTATEVTFEGGTLTVVMVAPVGEEGSEAGESSLVIGSTAGLLFVGTTDEHYAYIRPSDRIRSLDVREIRVTGSNVDDRINLTGVRHGLNSQPGHFDNLTRVVVHGGDGADTIHGTSFADEIFGDDGDDTIYGLNGDDTIDGGDHHDHLYGGAGADLVRGGFGNDVLAGTDTNHKDELRDLLFGGPGLDSVLLFSAIDLHIGIENL